MRTRRVLLWAASIVTTVLVTLLAYGSLVEPRLILDVEREKVTIPQLSAEWDGTEVALIADLQIGMWFDNVGMAGRAIDRIVAEEPDVVLLGGDLVYGGGDTDDDVATLVEVIEPLTDAGIPAYAVLGNHDYSAGAVDGLVAALGAVGVTVLRNEAVALPSPSAAPDPLYLVGIDALRPGEADVDAALADLPDDAARLVLMHNPLVFPRLPARSAPLAMAGHTHCGQIALPYTGRWSWLDVTSEEKIVADAWAEEGYGAAGNRLFVTCGIGFSAVPVRLFAPPQVVIITVMSPVVTARVGGA